MKRLIPFLFLFSLIVACSIEPAKIDYGKDACHYCKMTIVEKTHAAQIVTKKGKSFKYDAIECMLNDLSERDESEIGMFLVTDYINPTILIDANTATYLISPAVQSPMGANLSAFAIKEEAEKYVKTDADKIFTWEEIQARWKSADNIE